MTLDHIEALTNPEIALRVYDKIFTARTGDEIFFNSQIPKRGIVIPPLTVTLYNQWKQDYVKAFQAVAADIGDDEFYLSMTMRTIAKYKPKPGIEREFGEAVRAKPTSPSLYEEDTTPIINDWICPLHMASKINDAELSVGDRAVYSLNGTWGLWFSIDGFMHIGGSEKFVDTFFQMIGSTIEEMALRYLFLISVNYRDIVWNYHFPNLFGEEQTLAYKEMYKSKKE